LGVLTIVLPGSQGRPLLPQDDGNYAGESYFRMP
jgi:hypothetical protein